MTDVRTPAAENPAVERTRNTETAHKGWSKSDTTWMLGLFGTAIGAGTLFLPINAGLGGFWPLLILALLAFPMTFYAHRGLTRFVLSGREGADITEVVEEHFGIKCRYADHLAVLLRDLPDPADLQRGADQHRGQLPGTSTAHHAATARDPVAGADPRPDGRWCAAVEQVIVKAMSLMVYPFIVALLFLAV